MRISAVYYIAAVTATAVAIASASPDQLVVDTASGKVRGVDEGTYSTFKGIPYGASTAGEGRWTAPKDPEPWEDVRDATKFGAICPQLKPVQDYLAQHVEMLGVEMSENRTYTIDEDCLFLNVYTPNVTGDLPVMVWIHGGEFIEGTGEQLPADRLVTEDVVVVTINYRLGFLGYFAHPDLEDTNFGLLDQVKALEWVQQNIATFGGDPGKVTIWGESAGASSVLALMVCPLAEGLFTNAIAESPALFESVNVTKEEGGDLGVALGNYFNATKAGSSQIDQMRKLPAEDIVQVVQNFIDSRWANMSRTMFNLFTDDTSMPLSIYEAFQAGTQHQGVNLMIGNTKNDCPMPDFFSLEQYHSLIDNAFGGNPSMVQLALDLIPASTNEEALTAFGEYGTNVVLSAGSFAVAKAMARSSSNASTFYYFFDYVYPNHKEDGAFHGAEVSGDLVLERLYSSTKAFTDSLINSLSHKLPFVLNYSTLGPDIPTYWTNFAKTGDPNGEKSDSTWLPNWPSFEEGSYSWQVLGSEISNEPIPETKVEMFQLGDSLLPPNYIVGTGPLFGSNMTWSLENGVPEGPQA